MTDSSLTFEELMDYHIEMVEEEFEHFPGDVPNQGVSAILQVAVGFDEILKDVEMDRANEDIDDPDMDAVREALERQCIRMLAAMANLKREYDLDIEDTFKTNRARVDAIRAADDMEELQAAMEEAGLEMEIGGVDIGDNVDADDYDPDDPDKGIQ